MEPNALPSILSSTTVHRLLQLKTRRSHFTIPLHTFFFMPSTPSSSSSTSLKLKNNKKIEQTTYCNTNLTLDVARRRQWKKSPLLFVVNGRNRAH
ncbi:hypothetical protein VIGAN_07141500 [Vigna angularis var. angularis]|uniref:Uncharacterized protein n=1 Tax=Vigna angularis var. angularis TaxID=157739 RepID=A0A0S3SIK1_PHAAN|nr:hypothetical protein VIGAN_07141500 [Vigna angularis var. angularis]